MGRKYVDCRGMPNSTCTVAIAADGEAELLEAAVSHAKTAHGMPDTPELRSAIKQSFKELRSTAAAAE